MKKKFFIFILLFLSSVCFSRNNADINESSDFLSYFSEIKTIASKFTLLKYSFIAETPLTGEGFFYFQNPDKLYWEYEKPYSYGFLTDGNKTFSWQKKDGTKKVKETSSKSGVREMTALLRIFVSMDIQKISKIYTINRIDGGILLLPKDQSEKQMIKDIKIMFDENISAVKNVTISERSGDKTEIIFFDTVVDGQLPQNAFTL